MDAEPTFAARVAATAAAVARPASLVAAQRQREQASERRAAVRQRFKKMHTDATPSTVFTQVPADLAAEDRAATAAAQDARAAVLRAREPYSAAMFIALQPLGAEAAARAAAAALVLAEALGDLDAVIGQMDRAHVDIALHRRPPAVPHAALLGLASAWGAR